MRARRPSTSGSSGMSEQSARPSRMASEHNSLRISASPALAEYPSLKIRYRTASTAVRRSGSRWSGGTRYGMRAWRIFFLARTRRWAQGRLRNEEGSSDLGGGEASQRSERERHLCLGGERWVTTGEHEPKPIVRDSTRLI